MKEENIKIHKKYYSVTYDESTGEITGLYDMLNPEANWKAEASDKKMGTIFLHGTQDCEDEIPFSKVERTDNGFTGTSATGVSSVAYAFEEDRIQIKVKTDKDCGPRVGVQMNLNLLDMPTRLNWVNQCMPKVIYTDDEFGYAYFIFATADGRFLGLTVNGEFAAWRIQYSYDGHKMTGFQILMQADDVICEEGRRLPSVDSLSLTLIFSEVLSECMEKVADQLGVEIAMPEISGGLPGSNVPINMLNSECRSAEPIVITPEGDAVPLEVREILPLTQNGIYTIKTTGREGKVHRSRILCHEGWKELYHKINYFYRDYFQDECGAFYRVIKKKPAA